jgi:hypothetical protein
MMISITDPRFISGINAIHKISRPYFCDLNGFQKKERRKRKAETVRTVSEPYLRGKELK